MISRRLYFLCLIVFVILIGCWYGVSKQHSWNDLKNKIIQNNIEIKGDVDPYIRDNVYYLTSRLHDIKAFKGKKIELRIANFGDKDKVEAPDKDNFDISVIWLGSQEKLNVNYLDLYDYVFANSQLLVNFLRAQSINAYYLPMGDFSKPRHLRKNNKNEIFGIIGDAPEIINELNLKKLKYKLYSLDNVSDLINDLPRLKAVFTTKTNNFDISLDLHLVFFKLINYGIPIATRWDWPLHIRSINIFNDAVSFWMYDELSDTAGVSILIDELNNMDKNIQKRIIAAKKLSEIEFSLEKTLKRIESATNNIEENSDENIFQFNADLGVATGHIGSGDYWLATDLLSNLANDNELFGITYFNSFMKYNVDVNIIVRGFLSFGDNDLKGKKNILYIAYPQFGYFDNKEAVENYDEYAKKFEDFKDKFDAIVVSSERLARTLNNIGVNAFFIPQFTNTDRFFIDFDEELKTDILFVGLNAFYRRAVHILNDANIPVSIYGPGYPDGMAQKTYLDNRILRKYYSSAKIVLNDTRDGMKELGFVSNRIYDASACGSLVISDYMKEIEEIYGDSVVMWKTEEELVSLVKYYLDPQNENERLEKANRAREITLKNFTAKIAAKKFEDIIKEVK
ncbi:MAG: glycosyltransferase family 1 protein [Alphaproteobacteria bacterium]|nr:glycosyltransferase family 1 protein [Alphaproteobacteria bacterium]